MSLYSQLKNAENAKNSEQTEEFTLENILDGPVKKPASSKIYKSPEERYADAHTTAVAFFAVGGIGLALMILTLAGILSLPINHFALYSMSVFFLIFLVVGFFSQRSSKKILALSGAERARVKKITDWYEAEGIHADALKKLIEEADKDAPEVFYLQKYELLQQLLRQQFPDENEALLDKLASDFSEEDRIDAMMAEEVRLEAAIREKRR